MKVSYEITPSDLAVLWHLLPCHDCSEAQRRLGFAEKLLVQPVRNVEVIGYIFVGIEYDQDGLSQGTEISPEQMRFIGSLVGKVR